VNKAISIKPDETNFVFKFETDGSLSAEDVLKKAISMLSDQAKELSRLADTI
jgi:DNA-directed RNA polymerase subunit L